ncbi:MAG: hypothetical protein HETSPECPRED_000201 [Heterodermia speciosa]|uniref:F-box domain-containing protein n=1 Tax=Heterodermia speciosa TaxID=116794 RepID=A0A8H3EEQ8_9LECA|nr:MAG: hypothetical protein HETSPECPRED_000201 [Heterodermia speciosa]
MPYGDPRSTISLLDLPPEIIGNIVSHVSDDQELLWNSWHEEPSTGLIDLYQQTYQTLSRTCHYLRGVALSRLSNVATVLFKSRHDYQEARVQSTLQALEAAKRSSGSDKVSVINVIVCFLEPEPPLDTKSLPEGFIQKLCYRLVHEIKPKYLTIIFPSQLFPFLSSSGQHDMISPHDGWAFDMPLHVVHLSCQQSYAQSEAESLWDQPWSMVTLNEGSFLKAYSTYDFHTKRNPSIFLDTRFCKNVIKNMWSVTVREFEYVAIFPLTVHLKRILQQLGLLTNLRTLSTRLAPHENSSILLDMAKVRKAQFRDLWSSVEENYASIVDYVLIMREKHHLRTFKALDCVHLHVYESLYPMMQQRLQDCDIETIPDLSKNDS